MADRLQHVKLFSHRPYKAIPFTILTCAAIHAYISIIASILQVNYPFYRKKTNKIIQVVTILMVKIEAR